MNEDQKTNSRRINLIEATTNLSTNVGKINGKVKYLIYGEDEKRKKQEELKTVKEDLEAAIENIHKIAKHLEIEL